MKSLRIFVWGSGGAGQLGLGTTEDHAIPQELICPVDPRTVVTGGCHSAGVNVTGELYVWGDNEKHQLGMSREQHNALVPTRQSSLASQPVDAVACGWSHTIVVESGDIQRIRSIGANDHYQLGRHTTAEDETDNAVSVQLPSLLSRRRVMSLACGWKHSLLVLDDGSVYSWGSGRHGELGLGRSTLTASSPTLVGSMGGFQIDKVWCGWQHSIFHSSASGRVFACGNNRHGQLGVPKSAEPSRFEPQEVVKYNSSLAVRQVSVGWHFVVCVTRDGELYAWGKGSHGQLGLGTFESVDVPTKVPFEEPPSVIACGSEHTMVASTSGDLYTCGWGEHGNLGHGDTENQCMLTKVTYFEHERLQVHSVRAGGAVSIALAY